MSILSRTFMARLEWPILVKSGQSPVDVKRFSRFVRKYVIASKNSWNQEASALANLHLSLV